MFNNKPTFDKVLEISAISIIAIMAMYDIYSFSFLPEIIPTHFNAEGVVDGTGNRLTIFIMPFIAFFLCGGLIVLNRYPQIFNYPVKVTENNREKLFAISTRFIRILNLIICTLFAYMNFSTIQNAIKSGNTLNIGVVFVFIGVIIFSSVVFIVKMYRVK